MRLASYNILNGGEGRADPLAEVLIAQKPDVIALIEADVPFVTERIARRLGMQIHTGVGAKHTVAILTALPMLESIDHSSIDGRLDRGMLEVVVETASGPLPVIALHLPAQATIKAEQNRLKIWGRVLNRLHIHRDERRPHIICGDFNANAPSQMIDPDRCKQATREAWLANGNKLPRDLIKAVEAAGYTDSYRAFDGDAASVTGSFDTQTPGQRVDHIFTFGLPTEAIKGGWIEQDRLAKYASDHFPVGVELSLPNLAQGVEA